MTASPKNHNLTGGSLGVEGVVLAAGFSKRAGGFKMELPLGGKTLLERSIEGMYHISERIIVVGGYRIERIREILEPYKKVDVVYNKDFESGMFSSVKKGVSEVTALRFFLLPGDQPLVREEVYKRMLKIDGDIIIPTCRGKKGHPVLMKSHLIGEILKEPDDSTLRDFIHKKGATLIEVEDEGIILDIDVLEDYERIRKEYERDK
ncbi:nucleotidyltransferase family protein [candidate division WOR-3 bacterium]|nr:nucleotidyltransferase family protein [candidate division WOR-3 bacterium]